MPSFSAVIRPSRLLFLYAAALQLLSAATALLYFRLPEMLLWAICLTVSFRYCTGAARTEKKTVFLTVSDDGTAVLSVPNGPGKKNKAVLQGSSVTMSLFMLLVLKTKNGEIVRLPVLPDSTDTESFRRLKVWARWGTEPADIEGRNPMQHRPTALGNSEQ